jgi:hypothetical protein
MYNNPRLYEFVKVIVPWKDRNNDELKEFVKFRTPLRKHNDNSRIKDSRREILEFLENKTEHDSFDIADDLTEEELDQALFEASYVKPQFESDEFISKNNNIM